MCAKIHDLEQCKAYLTKSVDERSKYLSTKKLCYGCLKPIAKAHIARNCNERQTWRVCNKRILRHCMDLSWKKKKKTQKNQTRSCQWCAWPKWHVTRCSFKKRVTIYDENIVCVSSKSNAQVISMSVVTLVIKYKDFAKEIMTHSILQAWTK